MADMIAAWAAVAAAVFSLTTVILSNRFLRRTQTQQWRRDRGRELAVDFCSALREVRTHWRRTASIAERSRRPASTDKSIPAAFRIHDYTDEFDEALATTDEAAERAARLHEEIELIMSDTCRDAASKFFIACCSPIDRALSVPSSIAEAYYSDEYDDEFDVAHHVFISACRADLGIGPKPPEYTLLGSLIIGVINGRRSARGGECF